MKVHMANNVKPDQFAPLGASAIWSSVLVHAALIDQGWSTFEFM